MKQLESIIPELTKRFPAIEVLYLFGSRADGAAATGSDIDIAVYISPDELEKQPLIDLEIEGYIEKVLKKEVDVVVMQRVSPILQHQVISRRERLFEANPERRAALEVISFKQYVDVRHYQQKRLESAAHG